MQYAPHGDQAGSVPAENLSSGPFRTAAAEPMAIEDIRDAVILRENGVFLLTDKHGNVPDGNESGFGLYFADTRYLSVYEFGCTSAPLVMLLSTAGLGYASEQVLTNPSMLSVEGKQLLRETVEVRRQRRLDEALVETVGVTNFNAFAVTLDFTFRFGADFADIFEIRGQRRERRGELAPVNCFDRGVDLSYATLDGRKLTCRLQFDQDPLALTTECATFRFGLGPRQQLSLELAISLTDEGDTDNGTSAIERDGNSRMRQRRLAEDYKRWRDRGTRVQTRNEIFNAVLDQSLNDIRTLWNREGPAGGYLSAGSPWFDTLFGRDSLIASFQLLAFNPEIARNTLSALARHQGTTHDDWRDEQPGKIMHELRSGEMARTGEVPFGRYYGSIDATPLMLVLATEYWRWTADLPFLRRLKPHLLACFDWIHQFGDCDGDGYLEYRRQSAEGLLNQGWKDSADAIAHRDGSFAASPIALVEVQAYLYAGLQGLVEIAGALGIVEVAEQARREAQRLRRRFNCDFWMADEQFYALALDGQKQRVESISSNPGQALFAGIMPSSRGAIVAARLMDEEMFSGWGVRTLSSESARFNPMGYHIGSIWPHDNSLIAAGFKRTGQETALEELATAMYDAARSMEYYRLPELFCGTPRSSQSPPVPYPVACRPQAWAAGTMPLILSSLLGLCADAPRGELRIVRPHLPGWLDHVHVRNLRVGNTSVELLYELKNRRTEVTVLDDGGLRVSVVSRWPR